MNWKHLFTRPKPEHFIVEVERPRPILDEEYKNSIPSLAGHPGFIYLMNKLKLERAKLQAALIDQRHDSLRDVEFIQSGLFWTDWLQKQVEAAVGVARAVSKTRATQAESSAFEEMATTIDLIGQESPHKG